MDQSDQNYEVSKAIDAYLHGLESGDASEVPLADDARFLGLLMDEPIKGRDAVAEHVSSYGDRIENLIIRRKVIDDDYACVLFTWREHSGTEVEICDYFEFDGAQITYIRPYFDPRPFLEQN